MCVQCSTEPLTSVRCFLELALLWLLLGHCDAMAEQGTESGGVGTEKQWVLEDVSERQCPSNSERKSGCGSREQLGARILDKRSR